MEITLDLTPADVVKLKHVPIVSCDAECSFNQYKPIPENINLLGGWNVLTCHVVVRT